MSAPDHQDSTESWGEWATEQTSRSPAEITLYDSVRTGEGDDNLIIYNRDGSIGEWVQSDTYEAITR